MDSSSSLSGTAAAAAAGSMWHNSSGGGGGLPGDRHTNNSSINPAVAATTSVRHAANKARTLATQWAQSAGQTVQQWTVPKYTLPDKCVASQVLMYRQLLHTRCRLGLKLSRDYQATPAQQAVLHMPWWSEGIEETGKMVIAYDNLIRRLWLHGAIFPHANNNSSSNGDSEDGVSKTTTTTRTTAIDLLTDHPALHDTVSTMTGTVENPPTTTSTTAALQSAIETYLDHETGMPPIPHDFWVSRLGFQQPDPVTDFRSGGVLSLAMMVWMVESSPAVFSRYVRPHGDASVLPFGITSINVTDMMAKFLMLSKAVDKMDALMSQKPFWRMFADPNAILACQELAMDMLADVVVELRQARQEAAAAAVANPVSSWSEQSSSPSPSVGVTTTGTDFVSVFDFAHILQVTEQRVQHDLLGAGPKTVPELRQLHSKLQSRYQQQHEYKLARLRRQVQSHQQQHVPLHTHPSHGIPESLLEASSSDEQQVPAESDTTSSEVEDIDSHNNGSIATTTTTMENGGGGHGGSAGGIWKDQVLHQAAGLGIAATSLAGSMWNKIKVPGGAGGASSTGNGGGVLGSFSTSLGGSYGFSSNGADAAADKNAKNNDDDDGTAQGVAVPRSTPSSPTVIDLLQDDVPTAPSTTQATLSSTETVRPPPAQRQDDIKGNANFSIIEDELDDTAL